MTLVQGVEREVAYSLPDAGKRGRGKRTGFRDTYDFNVLMEDAIALIKLHFPMVEDWQAEQLAYDLQVGTRESRYWVQR